MAYNKSYNPDALPAHAEPEQAKATRQATPRASIKNRFLLAHHRKQRTAVFLPVFLYPALPRNTHTSQHRHVSTPNPITPTPTAAVPLQQTRLHQANSPASLSLVLTPCTLPRHPRTMGLAPPPVQPQRSRPPSSSRPPQSPVPPPLTAPSNDPQQLFPLFRAANASNSGTLTEGELGSALVNGDYTSFHPRTVRLMIRMFDRDGSGTINFDEFVSLWRYLAAWRELFDRFDEDRSGRVSQPEFEKALVAFGYRLSGKFISVIFGVFEGKGKQMSNAPKDPRSPGMSFDLFVQACISLKRMTDVFKRYDEDRDGYITLSFEEALTEILLLQE
ncbi:Calcium-binding EF-hand [Penicillium coprophilum]|uniref:Calcium-binding EF-hand n=1 Tax=Penicillium coprophilum TaxID=36646 RepID=UPI002383BFD0|nr:Calcium-binding EF-hand [Penicillium coprophilum]KAJ5154532.1 Calcium-binding EF-hand [Penicillium coprophilum]